MNSLVELATRAESQLPPPGSGPYSYVHTRGWCLATDQMTNGRLLDARVEETEREFWVAADGSGRIEETRDGLRSRMSGVYGPGGLSPGPFAAWPADAVPGPLLRQSGSPLPVGRIKDIASVWRVQTVPPALQASLLRSLATLPGLRLEETTDRAGRPGLAVSADDPPAGSGWRGRHVLVLDAATGMLLAAEEITLQGGGPVRPPGTGSYTSWLRTGYAADSDTRP